jgi:hypothetical protein
MQANTRRRVLGTLILGLALGAPPAGAETTICTVISSLPYTIGAQGSYCLDRNLSTNMISGAAITINVDFVVLDLNGFKVGGGGAGLATQTSGVFAQNHKNITVKNGNIRGFQRGVYLHDTSGSFTSSQGHLVEDIRADQNTYAGIVVEGRGNVVRNNQVVDTTGTTVTPNSDIFGLQVTGPGSRVINNDSTETVGVGTGVAYGIQVSSAEGAVVENNRVANSTLATGSTAISVGSGDDVLVVGNRMATTDNGVNYSGGSTGKFRDNITSGVTTPYSGTGTDVGNNQ